ncbi:hypothetical protein VTH06DRAFT_6709 [Thermothelomyces fergusii]
MPADPPGFFPPVHVIPPLSLPHRHTIILLHGRGLSWGTFGRDLLSAPFPLPPPSRRAAAGTLGTLRSVYPHARFVLPTAPRQRATIYARSLVRQWFDGWHLHDRDNNNNNNNNNNDDNNDDHEGDEEEWRCIAGLRDTVAHVHGLVRAEAALVGGARNVALGGLSQGCAAGLAALLLWDGAEPLAGFLGMCGWLVFERALVRGALEAGGEEDDGFDPFEREEEEDGGESGGTGDGRDEVSVEARVVRALREMLELDDEDDGGKGPTRRPSAFDTPVFLGHGLDDDKVPISRGRGAAEFLKAAGMHVEWKEYHDLGHWYSPAMLSDMASFLARRSNWDRDG